MAAARVAVALLCAALAGCGMSSSGAAPSTNYNPITGSTGGSGR